MPPSLRSIHTTMPSSVPDSSNPCSSRSANREAVDSLRMGARIQSSPMARLGAFLRNPFSFLFAGSSHEDRVAAYVIREHERGRSLAAILGDPYVRNGCTPDAVGGLLDSH